MREPTTVKSGKAGDVPIITIKAWMVRFLELVKGYSFEDEINMNELELFFKTLKGLVEKRKKERKRWKTKSKLMHCRTVCSC